MGNMPGVGTRRNTSEKCWSWSNLRPRTSVDQVRSSGGAGPTRPFALGRFSECIP